MVSDTIYPKSTLKPETMESFEGSLNAGGEMREKHICDGIIRMYFFQ